MMQTRLATRVDIKARVVSKVDKTLEQNITLAKGNFFKASTRNISTFGIGLTINTFLPGGLIIKLAIDGTPFGLKRVMKVKGEIRHCEYVKFRTYKCGVKFLDLPKTYKKAISQFVSTHEKRKTSRLKVSE